MTKILNDLKYAKTHEWVKVEGEIATIGISDYAQHSLGDVVYVETREVGEEVVQAEECGAVESVKAASDIIAPLSGVVTEINGSVLTAPELLNQDPYANWLFKIKVTDLAELDSLLDAEAYQAECE